MNSLRSALWTACGLCWVAVAAAQAPAPTNNGAGQGATTTEETPPTNGAATSPSAASSPHQHEVTGGTGRAMRKGMSPNSFVAKAAQDGMTEVKLAELASQKSQNQAITQFASHMQSDHSQANSELENIAKQDNITVPDKLDAKHQAEVDSLSGKSGADFDKAYAAAMVKAHKQAVALFKSATHSSDQNIASFANKTLPTLQSHERMAKDLASQLRVASADKGGTANR